MTRHGPGVKARWRAAALVVAAALAVGCAKDRPAASERPAAAGPAPEAKAKAVQPSEVAKALAVGITLDADDPLTCAPCHGAVVAEWQESLHARAHHAKDPLYAALRALRLEKQGPHIPAQCASCHNPRDLKDHESKAAKGGVTCATCHQLDGVQPGLGHKGMAALVVAPEKTFRGPRDLPDGTAPLHATGAGLPAISDGKTLCLACHHEEKNAAGVATCTTGVEYAEGGEQKPCTGCHMPEVQTPSGAVTQRPSHKSHFFLGPQQAHRLGEQGILAQAVGLSGRFEGQKLLVRLENKSAHAFPTGFPARMAVLVVRGLDASGKEVFRNVTAEPMKEHPEAVFNKGYADAEGKPALAAFAAKLVRDNRLKPAEVREVAVAVPKAAVKAELWLRYFLAAPPMVKAMGYAGPEARPVELAPVTVSR